MSNSVEVIVVRLKCFRAEKLTMAVWAEKIKTSLLLVPANEDTNTFYSRWGLLLSSDDHFIPTHIFYIQ